MPLIFTCIFLAFSFLQSLCRYLFDSLSLRAAVQGVSFLYVDVLMYIYNYVCVYECIRKYMHIGVYEYICNEIFMCMNVCIYRYI